MDKRAICYKRRPITIGCMFVVAVLLYNNWFIVVEIFYRSKEFISFHPKYVDGIPGLAPPAEESERLWKFAHKIQYRCGKTVRIGGANSEYEDPNDPDGAYDVCLEEKFWPLTADSSHKCLAYSFGVGGDISFDNELAKMGCEVHSFDPTTEWEDGKVFPSGVTFHKIGISEFDLDRDENGWKMRTLKTLLRELGHAGRTIDYLKVDTDAPSGGGFEDILMQELLDTDLHKCVRQFAMEVHIPGPISLSKWLSRCRRVYRQMSHLSNMGYKTFNVTDNVRFLQATHNDLSITAEKDVRPHLVYQERTGLWEIMQINTQANDKCEVSL